MKIAIIYYSHTGKTKAMAELLTAYLSKHFDVSLEPIQGFKGSVETYDVLLLGCPALGNEGIDAMFMEPFIEKVPLHGKPIALFGSYGWGNGEWMLDWAKHLKTVKKAKVFSEYLMVKGQIEEDHMDYIHAYLDDLHGWINRVCHLE